MKGEKVMGKKEMYKYIEQKKQNVIKQYEQVQGRIEKAENTEELIKIIGSHDFFIQNDTYLISDLLSLLEGLVDEYFQNNELFRDCEKQMTQYHITYVQEKYSIQFGCPTGYEKEIIVRYHGHIQPGKCQPYQETVFSMRDAIRKFHKTKRFSDFSKIVQLNYRRRQQTKNPFILCRRYISTAMELKNGAAQKFENTAREYEERQEKYERDMEIFQKEQEEAKIIKEQANRSLKFFMDTGWKIRYKGILSEDGSMYF